VALPRAHVWGSLCATTRVRTNVPCECTSLHCSLGLARVAVWDVQYVEKLYVSHSRPLVVSSGFCFTDSHTRTLALAQCHAYSMYVRTSSSAPLPIYPNPLLGGMLWFCLSCWPLDILICVSFAYSHHEKPARCEVSYHYVLQFGYAWHGGRGASIYTG
jgi:hypothetical protein